MMGDAELFRSLTAENLVELYPDKLTEIHSYAKTEIIEFLAPVLNSDVEVDARCAQLSALRDKLCQTLCELFPEFGSRELYNRRRPHTYASDIFHIGITIRNSNIDKNMKAVFKPETAQSDDHNEDDANPDVSMIDQTDVIETCLLLRDSVISLKAVIRDLQQEVTDLKSHVTRLDGRLTSKDVSTNVDAAEPDTVPAVNALIPTAPQLETIEGTPPEDNPPHVADNDNFQFPKSHQKKLLNGNIGITSQRSGIVGTSTDSLSFSGTIVPPKSQIRSIYVGNCNVATSVSSIRTHLGTIGLSESTLDILPLTTRYSDMKSFCITLNSIDAENKAYEAVWPSNVAVRPYRPPMSGKHGNHRQQNKQRHNQTGGRPPRYQNTGKKQHYNGNKQYVNTQYANKQYVNKQYGSNTHYKNTISEQQQLQNSPQIKQQPQYMPLPVHHQTRPTWSGVYPGYNGQFMPLMSLPTTI